MGVKPGLRVAVAMSGGVDSSLTAALLVHQGYDVIGVTMKLWEPKFKIENEFDGKSTSDAGRQIEIAGETASEIKNANNTTSNTANDTTTNTANDTSSAQRGCCSHAAITDAAKVAAMLNIPHYVLDFKELFRKMVIDYFCRDYSAGRTPNPCIACNRYIKFGGLLDKALALDAQYVATGHYARIAYDEARQRRLLLKGVDLSKDQSYVLYHLNQRALKHLILPLGGYTKKQTRELAKKWGLAVADKPESQEICFIPGNDYKTFLQEKIPGAFQPGKIVDTAGNVLGMHQGVQFFTVGQRKGLGVAWGKPAYVVAINPEKKEVVVGDGDEVFAGGLIAGDLTFIGIEKPDQPFNADVKIRYAAPPAKARIIPLSCRMAQVDFQSPQRAITPGQAVVFYTGDEVIGGGTILRAV